MTMPMFVREGIRCPMGWAAWVPIIATGITGAPDSNASRATPVLPR